MLPTRRTTRTTPATTTAPTTTVTEAQLQALIDQGVAAALAERDASRSRDGDNNHGSGTDERRASAYSTMKGTYTDYLECLDVWNSHMRGCGHDVGIRIAMDGALKRLITDQYCPSGRDQKAWNLVLELKSERRLMWMTYNQRFQDLGHSCGDRMYPEESQKWKRYVVGLPDIPW
ncbi:hypothetical protein Tco_0629138 [Tanacetum coccineum]|uniref:Uncharacterized protein n=1 Tax=Tanacetum coccineum TaxID=301880 RepID=A0ABQ4WSB5_9ASTR